MKTIKRQSGMSFFALLIVLGMCSAVGLFGLRVLPLYMDYMAVSGAMDDLPEVPGLGKKGKKGILKRLDNQLYINDVKTFDVNEDTKITKHQHKNAWVVTADYEAKTVYAANVSIIIHFKKTVEVQR